MRIAYLFPAIAAVGLVPVVIVGHAIAAPVIPAVAGYAAGVAFTIVASIVVNSCNATRYGRQVWDDRGLSDYVDEPSCYGQSECPWGDVQRSGYHVADMRRDRVRRHAEGPATFPAGDVA